MNFNGSHRISHGAERAAVLKSTPKLDNRAPVPRYAESFTMPQVLPRNASGHHAHGLMRDISKTHLMS